MTNIKLKNKATHDLPAFVREDYTTFKIFLDSYHEWLETQQADIKLLSDIDTTLESFIINFKREVNYQNIKFPNINEQFLLRHMKKLYLSKGTEESYVTLFKLLYNKDIIIKYPDQMTLKSSDGKWEQLISIFVEASVGAATVMNNRVVQITNPTLNRIIDVTVENVSLKRTGGGLSTIFLESGGSGYTTPTIAFMGGNGGNAAAHAIVENGVITSISLISGGSGYTSNSTTISGGGTGADIDATFSNGVITSIELVSGGSGYTTGAIIFSGGGYGAHATATVNNGAINSITLISGGVGYTSPAMLFVGGGHGAVADVITSNGVITSIALISGGSSYTNPAITFTGGGNGANASVATSDGVITSIIVDNPGTNYISPPILTINGSNTTPAIVSSIQMFVMPDIYECNIEKHYYGNISVNDIISYKGFSGKILPTVNSFEIIEPGKNFRLGQTFEIETIFGKGALAKVSKLNSNKGIAELKFIKYGYGYVSDFDSYNIIPPNISQSNPYEGFTSSSFNLVGNFTISTLYHLNDVVYDTTNSTYYKCILSYTSSPTPTVPSNDGTHWGVYLGTEETRVGTFHEYVITDPTGGYVLKETLSTTPNYDFIWTSTTVYALNKVIKAGNNFYKVTVTGTTSGTIPSHTSGSVLNGTCTLLFLDSSDLYAIDFAGDIQREFYSSNKYKGDLANGAKIRFKLGAVCKYPGHYINSDGMTSDEVKIQDSHIYQKYSYIIQVDEKIDSYRDIVKSFLHPAGMAMFGEYNIHNEFNVKLKLNSIFPRFYIRHADAVTSVSYENINNWFNKEHIINDDSCLLYNIQKDWTDIFDPDVNWSRYTTKIVSDASYDIIGGTKDFTTVRNIDTPGSSDNVFFKLQIVSDNSYDIIGGAKDITSISDPDYFISLLNMNATNWVRFTSKEVSDASYAINGGTTDWTNILDLDTPSNPQFVVRTTLKEVSDVSYGIIGGTTDWTNIPDPDYFTSLLNMNATNWARLTIKEVSDVSYGIIGGTTDWTNILDPDYFISISNMNATNWARLTIKEVSDASYGIIGGTTDWTNILDLDTPSNPQFVVRFTVKEVSDASYGIIGGTTDWTNIPDPDYFTSLLNMNATNWVRFTSKEVSDASYGIIGGTTDWTNILDYEVVGNWVNFVSTIIQPDILDSTGISDPDYFIDLNNMLAQDWVRSTNTVIQDPLDYSTATSSETLDNIFNIGTVIQDPLDSTNNTEYLLFTKLHEVSDASYGIIGGTTDWTNILDYEVVGNWVNFVSTIIQPDALDSTLIDDPDIDWTRNTLTVIQDPLDYSTATSSETLDNIFNIGTVIQDPLDSTNNTEYLLFTKLHEVSDASYGIIGGTTDWTNILDYEVVGNWVNFVSTIIQPDALDSTLIDDPDIDWTRNTLTVIQDPLDYVLSTQNETIDNKFNLESKIGTQLIIGGNPQTSTQKSLTLAANSNESSDAYINTLLTIESGAGVGQVRTILSSRKNLITKSSTINDASWIKGAGFIFTSNSAVGINGSMTADTLNLGSSTINYDYYKGPISVIPGTTYIISRYVKLGTATNICMVVNDTLAWNTVGGRSYTAADGLNALTFTRISYTFVAPTSGVVNIHFGKHTEGGLTAQSVGTAICDGYQLELGSTATEYIRTESLAAVGVGIDQPWSSNKLTWSSALSNGAWVKSSTTITENSIVAPDGTMTAALIFMTSVGYPDHGSYPLAQDTLSFYAKFVTSQWILATLKTYADGSETVWFDLVNGTVGVTGSNLMPSITSIGNGWYRCVLSKIIATTSEFCIIAPTSANGNTSNVGCSMYVWGPQLESGSIPTQYVATTSSSFLLPDSTSIYRIENSSEISAILDQDSNWTRSTTTSINDGSYLINGGTPDWTNILDYEVGNWVNFVSTVIQPDALDSTGISDPDIDWIRSSITEISDASYIINGGTNDWTNILDPVTDWTFNLTTIISDANDTTAIPDPDTNWSRSTTTSINEFSYGNNLLNSTIMGAIFYAPLKTSAILELGAGAPSFTRASIATVSDFEGNIKVAKSGEIRFAGARRVENLLSNSTNVAAILSGGYETVISNFGVAPDGSLTSTQVTWRTVNPYFYFIYFPAITGKHIFSIYIKGIIGQTQTIGSHIGSGWGTNNSITCNGNWQRFSFIETFSGGGFLVLYVPGPGVSLEYWGAQLENVNGQSVQIPSEHVSTNALTTPFHGAGVDGVQYFPYQNGNTVTNNIVTEAIGTSIPEVGTLIEPELITNGTFDTDLAGWTAQTANPVWAATIAWNNGKMLVTGGNAFQSIAVTIGKTYKVSGLSTNATRFDVSSNPSYPNGNSYATKTTVGGVQFELTFKAIVSSLYLLCFGNTNWDNISIKETVTIGLSGYLSECASQNICLQSNAFTTIPWMLGGVIPVQNAVGISGAVNEAWTLTDNSASVAQYIQIQSGFTLTAAPWSYSVFVKKTIGAPSAYPSINMCAGTIAAIITIDTSNGIATPWTAYTGFTMAGSVSATCVSFNSLFWRVTLTFTGTAAAWSPVIYPAATTNATQSTGIYDVAAQGSAVIQGAQIELGSFATSYIPTTTVAGTRYADVLTYPNIGNISGTSGSLYVECILPNAFPVADAYLIGTNAASSTIQFMAGKLAMYDGTAYKYYENIAEAPSSNLRKYMNTWSNTTTTAAKDGTQLITAVFDGDTGIAAGPISIGGVGGQWPINGNIKNVRIWTAPLSNAILQSMTLSIPVLSITDDWTNILDYENSMWVNSVSTAIQDPLDFATSTSDEALDKIIEVSTNQFDNATAMNNNAVDNSYNLGFYLGTLNAIQTIGAAQTSSTSSLTLMNGSNEIDDAYAYQRLTITGGTGIGQVRTTLSSRKNLLTYSQSFDNAVWSKSNATISANAAIAPDGTLTADKLNGNNTNSTHTLTYTTQFGNGIFEYSLYAKAAGYNYIVMEFFQPSYNAQYYMIINLITGTVSFKGTYFNTTPIIVQNVGSGWFRIILGPMNIPAVYGPQPIFIGLSNDGVTTLFTDDGISGVYIWGAQLEIGITASEYIHTEALPAVGVSVTPQWSSNLLMYSEQFDNAVWIKGSSSVTANAAIAPDGRLTAYNLVENIALSSHDMLQNIGSAKTMSIYAKQAGRSKIWILSNWNGDGAVFDLIAGTYTSVVNGSASITSVGNGWYRCSFTFINAPGHIWVELKTNNNVGTNEIYQGDGTSGIYIWCAQSELGLTVTPYIATTNVPSLLPDATSTYLLEDRDMYDQTSLWDPNSDSIMIQGDFGLLLWENAYANQNLNTDSCSIQDFDINTSVVFTIESIKDTFIDSIMTTNSGSVILNSYVDLFALYVDPQYVSAPDQLFTT